MSLSIRYSWWEKIFIFVLNHRPLSHQESVSTRSTGTSLYGQRTCSRCPTWIRMPVTACRCRSRSRWMTWAPCASRPLSSTPPVKVGWALARCTGKSFHFVDTKLRGLMTLDMFMDTWICGYKIIQNITKVNYYFIGILNFWIVLHTKYMKLRVQWTKMNSQCYVCDWLINS